MERLTSPDLNVDPGTDRFLSAKLGGKEIDWKQCRDSTLNVLINGPTSNGFGKDIFRKMARDLYGRLKAYEDTGWTPEMLRKLGENAWRLWDFAQAAESMTLERFKELAEADKDGRVIVLPAKKGDTWKKAMSILDKKYAEAKKLPFVRDPLAWALYHTWREFDDGKRCD